MKKIFILLCAVFFTAFAFAQTENPVSFAFTTKKVSNTEYQIIITATIKPSWHLYSQTQPSTAVNEPTKITFNKNPLATFTGKTKEAGKMELFEDKKLKIAANQYANRVVFTQTVKLKAAVKTTISGSVYFQTCDDKKCLPPKTVPFSVSLK
jgi:thiol:disulfide interchange protein